METYCTIKLLNTYCCIRSNPRHLCMIACYFLRTLLPPFEGPVGLTSRHLPFLERLLPLLRQHGLSFNNYGLSFTNLMLEVPSPVSLWKITNHRLAHTYMMSQNIPLLDSHSCRCLPNTTALTMAPLKFSLML